MDEDLKEKSKKNLKVILRKMKLLNYENINNKLWTPINFIRKKLKINFYFVISKKSQLICEKRLKIIDCSQIYEN
jgi:hypothetical protein